MPEVVSISAQSHRGGTSPRTTARLPVTTESVSQSLDQLHVSVGLDIFHLTSQPPIQTAKEEGDVEDEREREGLSHLWSHPAIVKEAKQKRPPKNGTRSDGRLKLELFPLCARGQCVHRARSSQAGVSDPRCGPRTHRLTPVLPRGVLLVPAEPTRLLSQAPRRLHRLHHSVAGPSRNPVTFRVCEIQMTALATRILFSKSRERAHFEGLVEDPEHNRSLITGACMFLAGRA